VHFLREPPLCHSPMRPDPAAPCLDHGCFALDPAQSPSLRFHLLFSTTKWLGTSPLRPRCYPWLHACFIENSIIGANSPPPKSGPPLELSWSSEPSTRGRTPPPPHSLELTPPSPFWLSLLPTRCVHLRCFLKRISSSLLVLGEMARNRPRLEALNHATSSRPLFGFSPRNPRFLLRS